MNRRSILKTLFPGFSTNPPSVVSEQAIASPEIDDLGISSKRWHVLSAQNDRQELLAGKPVMNWQIDNGNLICMGHLADTTVFLSDYRLSKEAKSFKAEMLFTFFNELFDQAKHELHVGFRFLSAGQCGHGHIDSGISGDGTLFIGQAQGARVLKENILKEPLRLVLSVIPQSAGGCYAKIKVFDRSGNTLATLSSTKHSYSEWQGNIGIFSHYTGTSIYEHKPSVTIRRFKVDGEKLIDIKIQDERSDYINSEITT